MSIPEEQYSILTVTLADNSAYQYCPNRMISFEKFWKVEHLGFQTPLHTLKPLTDNIYLGMDATYFNILVAGVVNVYDIITCKDDGMTISLFVSEAKKITKECAEQLCHWSLPIRFPITIKSTLSLSEQVAALEKENKELKEKLKQIKILC